MKVRTLVFTAVLAGTGLSTAQAAEIRLGLHAESAGILFAEFGENQPIITPGLDASATWPLTDWLAVRAKVSAQYWGSPIFRLDGSLLSRGDFYFGAGVGSGLGTGDAAYQSYIFLTNAQAFIGKNFGPAQVELYARAGLISSLGLSVNYLLPQNFLAPPAP